MEINALTDEALPPLDGLYIGGGFPETNAEMLAKNQKFRQSLKNAIEAGLPVYAECGGLMYLGEHIIVREQSYPMVGALPFTVLLEKKPQGHGYTVLEVDRPNPYFPTGTKLTGTRISLFPHHRKRSGKIEPGLPVGARPRRSPATGTASAIKMSWPRIVTPMPWPPLSGLRLWSIRPGSIGTALNQPRPTASPNNPSLYQPPPRAGTIPDRSCLLLKALNSGMPREKLVSITRSYLLFLNYLDKFQFGKVSGF